MTHYQHFGCRRRAVLSYKQVVEIFKFKDDNSTSRHEGATSPTITNPESDVESKRVKTLIQTIRESGQGGQTPH